jgi:hypothetical protein
LIDASAAIQDHSTGSSAHALIDRIDVVKNSKISDSSLSEIKTHIRLLVNLCNSKLLRDFPIEVIATPIDNIEFETSSAYFPNLKFLKMKNFVIEALNEAESLFDDSLCIDAMRVLVNYCNIVVFGRFDHGLIVKEKMMLDDQSNLSSNKSLAKSTHLENGDDSNG